MKKKIKLLKSLGFNLLWVDKLYDTETFVFETLVEAISAYRKTEEQDFFFTDKFNFLKYYLQENRTPFIEPVKTESRNLFSL